MKKIIETSKSKKETLEKLGWKLNGYHYQKLNSYISDNNIDISHFDGGNLKRQKWKIIEKDCPVCGEIFTTKKDHPREKVTCSYSCSNTYFRSGKDNPNWKETQYKTTCFLYHEKKCIICGEEKIVTVHHYDKNRENNNPENLIPMCPTHHQYVHSRYINEVIDVVNEYRDRFIKNS